jgi:acyl carrier protein phosphodiesterase
MAVKDSKSSNRYSRLKDWLQFQYWFVRYNGLKNLDKNSGGFVSKSGKIKT